MRGVATLFPRNPLCFERAVDVSRERWQIRRGFQSRPKNTRVVSVGEKSNSVEVHLDRCIRANRRKHALNAVEFAWRNFSDEFERHVKILRAHPARPFI